MPKNIFHIEPLDETLTCLTYLSLCWKTISFYFKPCILPGIKHCILISVINPKKCYLQKKPKNTIQRHRVNKLNMTNMLQPYFKTCGPVGDVYFFSCAKNLLIFFKSVISICNTFSFCLDCIFCLRLSAPANTKGFPLLTTLYRFTKKWNASENFVDTILQL